MTNPPPVRSLLEALTADPVWAFRWSTTRNPWFLHQLSCVSIPADRRDADLMRYLSVYGRRIYPPEIPAKFRRPLAHVWLLIDAEWPLGHVTVLM